MKLYLVRHGETEWNQAGRLQGLTDIPLSDRGREQAAVTAEALKGVPFDRVFCSPLCRARETAEILTRGRGLFMETDERLRELSFGAGEGQSVLKARETPGTPLHDLLYAPERYVPMEGGETFASLYERTESFLREEVLPLEEICGTVLLTAHGAVNRAILNSAAGLPLEQFWRFSLLNCAVSVVEVQNGTLRILEEGKSYV